MCVLLNGSPLGITLVCTGPNRTDLYLRPVCDGENIQISAKIPNIAHGLFVKRKVYSCIDIFGAKFDKKTIIKLYDVSTDVSWSKILRDV